MQVMTTGSQKSCNVLPWFIYFTLWFQHLLRMHAIMMQFNKALYHHKELLPGHQKDRSCGCWVILYDQSLHHSLHIIPHLDMVANCNFTPAWRRQTARRYSSYICISPGAGSLIFVYIYVYQQKSLRPALLQYSIDVDHKLEQNWIKCF